MSAVVAVPLRAERAALAGRLPGTRSCAPDGAGSVRRAHPGVGR